MTKGYYTILPGRSGVIVAGEDARDFLQGLVTQDVGLLDTQAIAYSALLTAQGKLDHEFFMYLQNDRIILECESARAEMLAKRLAMFRLRKKVTIETTPLRVLAAWGDDDVQVPSQLSTDPRPLPGAHRGIVPQDFDFAQLNAFEEVDFEFYHRLCIGAKVPLGSMDIAWGDDTAAAINLEGLNGVSYTKGCYMGQELTSRMHHRGLGKMALYTVRVTGDALPPFTDIVVPDGPLIGEMRSSVGDTGLAMLRHDQLAAASRAGVMPLGVELAA